MTLLKVDTRLTPDPVLFPQFIAEVRTDASWVAAGSMSSATDSPFVRFVLRKLQAETQYSSYRDARRSTAHHSFPTQQVLFDSKRYRTMAEENRRISTTPIPVPMPFGAAGQLAAAAAPTPSPLSQATPIASTPAEAPSTTAAAQTAPVPTAEPIVEGINKDVAMTDVPTTEQAPV